MNDMTQAQDLATAEQIDQENPLGVDGFEFVEFTGPEPEAMIGEVPSLPGIDGRGKIENLRSR